MAMSCRAQEGPCRSVESPLSGFDVFNPLNSLFVEYKVVAKGDGLQNRIS